MGWQAGKGGRILIQPNGATVAVSITRTSGASTTVYSDQARTSSVAMPNTVSSPTIYWLDGDDSYTVSCKVNGIECAKAGTTVGAVVVYIGGGQSETVSVDIETAQGAAGVSGSYLAYVGLRAAARRVMNHLPRDDYAPFGTLAADVPTVTVGTSATVTGRLAGPQTKEITPLGARGTWDATFGRLSINGFCPGLGFYHNGLNVEIQANTAASSGLMVWVFVNGQPTTATPQNLGAVSSGSIFVKLAFGGATRRLVEVYMNLGGQWSNVRVATGDDLEPMPATRPVVAWVSDSFWAGSGGTPVLQCADFLASRQLGVECYNISYGGTGYTLAGSFNKFGDAARVTAVALANPDLIVIQGSVNDDGAGTIQTDAAACYAAYAAALPNTPIIVLGPQPKDGTSTIGASRQANIAAVKAAALAAPNVIAFHDEVGSAAGVPAAYNSGTSYPEGSLVTSLGSVWRFRNGGSNGTGFTPGTSQRWELVTWAYWGTGQVGTTTGVGSRDRLLFSDGIHPTADGSIALASYTQAKIRADVIAYALAGTINVD